MMMDLKKGGKYENFQLSISDFSLKISGSFVGHACWHQVRNLKSAI